MSTSYTHLLQIDSLPSAPLVVTLFEINQETGHKIVRDLTECTHNDWQELAEDFLMTYDIDCTKCDFNITDEALATGEIRSMEYYTAEMIDDCNNDLELGYDSQIDCTREIVLRKWIITQNISGYTIVLDELNIPYLRFIES